MGRLSRRDAAWRDLRAWILHRDGWRCRECGATDVKLEVHHIRPREHGGTDLPSNLRTLCRDCHRGAHRRREEIGPGAAAWDQLVKERAL